MLDGMTQLLKQKISLNALKDRYQPITQDQQNPTIHIQRLSVMINGLQRALKKQWWKALQIGKMRDYLRGAQSGIWPTQLKKNLLCLRSKDGRHLSGRRSLGSTYMSYMEICSFLNFLYRFMAEQILQGQQRWKNLDFNLELWSSVLDCLPNTIIIKEN